MMSTRRLALRCSVVLVCLVAATRTEAGPEPETTRLRDGEPVEVTLPDGRRTWSGRIEVPRDAVVVNVAVSADREVESFLHYGRPALVGAGTEPSGVQVVQASHEILNLRRSDGARIRAGTWFLTVRDPSPERGDLSFEVAVFVDRAGGRRTLLPASSVRVTIPEPGKAFAMRTWLPRRASGAAVHLAPPVLEGLRFSALGPGGFVRRETTQERIALDAEDAPRGVYTLSLSAPAAVQRPPHLEARLSLSFPGGVVLPRPASPLLELGRSKAFLMGGPANGAVQPVRIPVPRGGPGFVLGASSVAGVNVDLFVRRMVPSHHREKDAEWLGLSVGPTERVVVGGRGTLDAELYHAEVHLVDDERPVEVVVSALPIDPEVELFTWGGDAPARLEPGVWSEGAVRVYESALSWHAIHVPAGTSVVHAQLLDSTGPLELVLARATDGGIVARAFTPLVDEHLEYEFAPATKDEQEFLVGVVNRATWDEEVHYRLAVDYDRRPELPTDMAWPPTLDLGVLTPAERTAAATVEITIGDCSGGSGVCVSPDGLVLSCRHCLKLQEGAGQLQEDGIIVAFPQHLEAPPIQAYYARILDTDHERDLVLLAPLRDVFNRPLPEDVVLPWLPLGDSSQLRLGEPLWVGGYPQMGSECSRTAVILSRGIVAGLERRPNGPAWIKTDAWVAPGHSGGPLVDARGRLVGIAAATLGNTESLGLAIPVGRLKADWRKIVDQHVSRAPPGVGGDGTGE